MSKACSLSQKFYRKRPSSDTCIKIIRNFSSFMKVKILEWKSKMLKFCRNHLNRKIRNQKLNMQGNLQHRIFLHNMQHEELFVDLNHPLNLNLFFLFIIRNWITKEYPFWEFFPFPQHHLVGQGYVMGSGNH